MTDCIVFKMLDFFLFPISLCEFSFNNSTVVLLVQQVVAEVVLIVSTQRKAHWILRLMMKLLMESLRATSSLF
jgi:hypothetical protein